MRTHRRSSALAAATGAQSWSYTTGGTARPSPAVAGAYAGAGDGDVYAFGVAGGGLARAARSAPGTLDRDDRLTITASGARRLTANQRR